MSDPSQRNFTQRNKYGFEGKKAWSVFDYIYPRSQLLLSWAGPQLLLNYLWSEVKNVNFSNFQTQHQVCSTSMTSFSFSFFQPLWLSQVRLLFLFFPQRPPPGFQLSQCPSTCVSFTIWKFLCIRFSLLKPPFFLLTKPFPLHTNKLLNLNQINKI